MEKVGWSLDITEDRSANAWAGLAKKLPRIVIMSVLLETVILLTDIRI